MTVRTAWFSFAAAVVTVGIPAMAVAQLPSSFKTPGNKGKANEAQICAADYEASVKPVAKWQRDQALERYGKRPEDFTRALDHLIPLSRGQQRSGQPRADPVEQGHGPGAEEGARRQAPRAGLQQDDEAEGRPGR